MLALYAFFAHHEPRDVRGDVASIKEPFIFGVDASTSSPLFSSVAFADDSAQLIRFTRTDGDDELPPNGVHVVYEERPRAPQGGTSWPRVEWWLGTSFEPIDYSARTGDDFFILGRYRDGATVIERWILTPPDGTPVIRRPIAPSAIGVPFPGDSANFETVQGGAWLPHDQRVGPLKDRRILIENHTSSAPCRVIAADPDGRFLVVLDSVGFRRVSLSDGTSHTIADFATLPPTASLINTLSFRHHAHLGRVLIARTRGYQSGVDFRLLLIDYDNDGIVDSIEPHNYGSMMNRIGSPPEFVDDF